MSGSHEVPAVHLLGPGMAALVQAIPIAARATGRPVVVVGGLAVLCRLSRPYRATTDLDTVSRLEKGQTGQLELLVAAGATLSGPTGVQLPTALGPVQIDVLQVADADFDPLPDDPTDRLHVLSHAWAADTATLMTLMADAPPHVDVLVAHPAALVAMKLQSAMNWVRQGRNGLPGHRPTHHGPGYQPTRCRWLAAGGVPVRANAIECLIPAAIYNTAQDENDPRESDHGRSKAPGRPTRG